MRKLLLVLITSIMITIAACTTTKYIDRPFPVETVKIEYVNLLYKDSVFVHDSIDRYISGDTVYQYKYKYIYKYLNRTDTIVETEKVEVPVEVKVTEIKEVNKIRWYLSALMWLGGLFTIFLSFKLGKTLRTKIIG